jgi:hypothetical protein
METKEEEKIELIKTGFTSPYKDITPLDKEILENNNFVFPSGSYPDMKKRDEYLDTHTDEEYSELKDNDLATDEITLRAIKTSVYNGLTTSSDLVNEIDNLETGKPLSTKFLNFKKLSKKNSRRTLGSVMGVAKPTNIPLWNSGFWITLKPINNTELINLQYAIVENEAILGKESNGLIYSNYTVITTKIIIDFLRDKIQSVSLTLEEDEDVMEFISIFDLFPIINGLLANINPRGHNYISTCKNSLKEGGDGMLCSNRIEGTIDFLKTLWVKRSSLTDIAIMQMINNGPNTIDKDSLSVYKEEITGNKDKDISLDFGESRIKLELKDCSIADYIKYGEVWLELLLSSTDSMFTENSSEAAKYEWLTIIQTSVGLTTYNHFINSVTISNDEESVKYDKYSEIDDVMRELSMDTIISEKVIDGINKFIDKNSISLVGVPSYTCPDCGIEQNEGREKLDFSEIIPINPVKTFLDHCVFVLSETTKRLT